MTLATVGPDGQPSARIVLLDSVSDARVYVFHQLPQQQRARTGRESSRGAGVPLGRDRPAGAHHGPGGKNGAGRGRGVLCDAAARGAVERLGVLAKLGDRRSRNSWITRVARLDQKYGQAEVPGAIQLGRLPAAARNPGILAEPVEPTARPVGLLMQAGWPLGDRSAGAVAKSAR